MCSSVGIDIGEFAQTIRRVLRSDQATFEVFQRFPFRVQRVGVTDVDIHARGRAEGVVLGPLGEVNRHRPAVDETVALRTFVGAGIESESAVSVESDVKVSDRDDR